MSLVAPYILYPAAASWYPTDLGSKLRLFVDVSDTTSLFTDSDNSKATNPTADGQTIYDINDLSGNSHHLRPWANGDTTATYKTSAGKHWLQIADRGFEVVSGNVSGMTTTDEIYVAISTSDTKFMLCGFADNGNLYAGIAQDASSSSTDLNFGTPTYTADNSLISTPTRDDLHTNWSTGSGVVIGGRSLNSTGSGGHIGRRNTYCIWGLTSDNTWGLTGDVYAIVHTTALTTGERASLQTWMSGLF